MFKLRRQLTGNGLLLALCYLLGGCGSTLPDTTPEELNLRPDRAVSSRARAGEPLTWMEPILSTAEDRATDAPAMQAFSARRADIRDVLVSLFEKSQLNLVIAPDVRGTVTFDFKATSQEEALISLLDHLGLSLRKNGDFVVVEGRKTEAFQLDYVSGRGNFDSGPAESVSSGTGGATSGVGQTESVDPWETLEVELRTLLGDDAGVVLKPEAGTVLVTGNADTLRLAESYLRDLEESLHRQVVIEAEVLEVTLDDEHRLGVSYAVFPDAFPSDEGGLLDGGAAILANLLTGGNAFQFGLIKSDRYAFVVDALKKAGQVRVLSRPRVATLNNQPATITVAEQVPVIERSVIDGETTRTEFDIRFEEAGVILNLLPQISAEGDIVTRISPRITEVVGQVTTPDGFQIEPILSVRQTNSTLRIKDGQSVVIGGLRFSRQTEIVDKIPILGDIPILGLPFRRTIQTQRQIELIIILTPHYLDDERQYAGLQRARSYYEETRRPFHIGLFFDNPPDGRFLSHFSDASVNTRLEEIVAVDEDRLDESARVPAEGLSTRGMALALMRRAVDEFQAGRFRQAKLRIDQAQAYGTLGGWPKLYLASIYRRQGELDKAESCLKELYLSNPRHVLVLNNLAALRMARGDWQGAVAVLEEAVAGFPDDPTLRCNLAAVLHRIGREGEALSQLQAVLQRDPRNDTAKSFLDRIVDEKVMIPAEPIR